MLIAVVMFVWLGGCAPPLLMASAGLNAVEESTAAFIRGELRSARQVPIGAVWEAAHEALEELRLPIKNSALYEEYGFIIARDLENRAVAVRLESASPVITKVKVRIGTWGDQAVSQLIMDRILARLPKQPVEGPPELDDLRPGDARGGERRITDPAVGSGGPRP